MSVTKSPAIEAKGLTKEFGSHRALDSLSLEVFPGEIYCMLGANGAGKTTTVNLLLSFLRPTGGSAKVAGFDVVGDSQQARARVTYLPEQVALYQELSGMENLRYLLELSNLDRSSQELSDALLEAGLSEEFHQRRVGAYSKGMRQKVGVALALAKKSEVLLLDEPTSGLDPASANEFSRVVVELAERGAAIFMVTHDLFRVKQISHRLGILKRGVLVEERDTAELEVAELEQLYLRHMRN